MKTKSYKTFAQHLKELKERPYVWAENHGIPHVTVWRAATRKKVSPKYANIIYLACGGKISLLSLIFPEQYPDDPPIKRFGRKA